MPRLLRFAYRKLGRRYPMAAVTGQLALAHIVVFGGVALLALYQSMSGHDFVVILIAAEGLLLLENALSLRFISGQLRPVRAWLVGERSRSTTVAAWTALVQMPTDYFRRRTILPVVVSAVPLCVFITILLELPAYSVVILLAGAFVVLLYGLLVRFFGLELILRPVLEDVAAGLPADISGLKATAVPLRVKLLLGLPLINVVTGVVVSGLSTNGQAELQDLGVDVVVALLVSFTFSLELTILLSRSILTPLGELRRATEQVAAGDLGVRVPVTSTDETGVLAQSFNAMVSGLQERERLQEALGTFVDPGVAERILIEGTDFEGEEVEVSVLFVDIRGFTEFAERSSAGEVVNRLNEFFGLIVPVITRHGGHATTFVGDGLLAVFGAPDRLADHADRALDAALDIAGVVAEHFGGAIEIGIGLNSGPVVVGTIGGGGRLDFTVIGDAVNTASRVESATRETGDVILLTEATRCLLERGHGRLAERGSVALKGKREEVRLWALEPTVAPERGAADAAAPGAH